MAYSTQTAVSDGTLVLLDIGIDYIERDEITVYFDSVQTFDWAWVGDSEKRISFDPAVPAGVEVLVKRTTDISHIRHSYVQGAAFTAATLDENLSQVLQIAQEAQESNLAAEFYNDVNMHGHRITALAPGVDVSDAATLGQLQGYYAAATMSAAAAAQSAIDAADASRLKVGTVITGAAGTAAQATITGNPGKQELNLVLPRGAIGPGVPGGGTAKQVLRKNQDNSGTEWASLSKADVGLSNVDNTADAEKPFVQRTSSTGAAMLPYGSTAQRPAPAQPGQTRMNLTTLGLEYWDGSAWQTAIVANPAGRVGIGNKDPQYMLDVTGTVRAAAFLGDGSGLTGIAPPVSYTGARGQVFTATGNFTVPDGITAIKVRGCGGGGGGASVSSSNGGTTSFGSYCSATGGSSGPGGGTGGVATGGDINLNSGDRTSSSPGLCGGSGMFGGASSVAPSKGYGNGGYYSGSHGGGGGYFEKYITGLTPGDVIAVTVGAGGSAAGNYQGSPGLVVVEW